MECLVEFSSHLGFGKLSVRGKFNLFGLISLLHVSIVKVDMHEALVLITSSSRERESTLSFGGM